MSLKCIPFLRPFNLEPASWPCGHVSALTHFLQVPVSLWINMGYEGNYTPTLGSSVKYLRLGRMNHRPLCKHLKAEVTLQGLAVSASVINSSKILERAK